MPKMKTNSGAKKRFAVTSTGKVKFRQAAKRHLLMQKSKSMKRKARATGIMFAADAYKVLENFMPYARRLSRKRRNPAPAAKVNAAE